MGEASTIGLDIAKSDTFFWNSRCVRTPGI